MYNNMASELLQAYAGLEPDGEHGVDTGQRFLSMLNELTCCKKTGNVDQDLKHIRNCIKWKTFDTDQQDMIVVQDIAFTSLCNHHVVPFMGVAHIGYVPRKTIAGLSKFARVVRHFARQLQVQERLTAQIADYLEEQLEPRGVAVLVKAEHLCMAIRGVHAPGTFTTTSTMRGVFGDHDRTAKIEFMEIIRGSLK